ncbi:hypothetical protein [Plantactinospora sp. GCM10030261]|uniref:hypothetical protein n=1 Tax=Plantactinospora sp. GCM10030261 TaxID=3273420 RepID=UPI003621015C
MTLHKRLLDHVLGIGTRAQQHRRPERGRGVPGDQEFVRLQVASPSAGDGIVVQRNLLVRNTLMTPAEPSGFRESRVVSDAGTPGCPAVS